MTLQSSGQIALSDLRTEYTNLGSTAKVAMNEFYYGSTHLKKNKCTDQARGDASHPTKASHFDNIPVSGTQIKLTNFYSKVYYYARQTVVQVNGNNANVDVGTIEGEALKKNSNNTVFFDVDVTGNCKATTTGSYGLIIPQGSRPNTTCYLTNDYVIYGKGGRGGDGNGNNGENGGTAFSVASNIYLKNNNRILGGGGGGGGGSGRRNSYNECYCCNVTNASIAGSGGGGGKGGGAGGSRGSAPGANFQYSGGDGGSGDEDTSSVPGSGGSGGSSCSYNTVLGNYCSNTGGNGGGWGQNGSSGSSGGSGGSAGNAIRRRSGAYYVVVTSGTTAGSTVTF